MKSKEEIEQLAEKEYREYPNNPINKEDWYYLKDNNCHRKRKAFVKGYTQCQEDMAKEIEKCKLFKSKILTAYNIHQGNIHDLRASLYESLNKQD